MRFDNRVIRIISEGKEDFEKALSFFFEDTTKITHYEINEDYGLIFYWIGVKESELVKPLPYPMNFDAAKEFAWNWLLVAPYGQEPDHDGSNGKGFKIFNDNWTHVNGHFEALVAIQPLWAMYGK